MKIHHPVSALALSLLLITGSSTAGAHHSFNMFDMSKVVSLHGTVKEVQWSNPHVSVLVVIDHPAPNQPAEWSVECTSPGNLTRMGWTRKSLKPGDKVDIDISPLRDGNPGGALRKATVLETGQVFTAKLLDAEKADDK